MALHLRGTVWYLKRRVPLEFAEVDSRKELWISLRTGSRHEARRRAETVWAEQLAIWKAKMDGRHGSAMEKYEAARALARSMGYRYMDIDKVVKLPRDEFQARVLSLFNDKGEFDRDRIPALLGTATPPSMTLSVALDTYWNLAADKTRGMSEDQIRRARNPRIKAFRNLISVVGDLAIDRLTQDDLLDFRDWWWERLTNEGLTPNSANKDLTHIAGTLRLVAQRKRITLPVSFEGLAFSEAEKETRLPFSESWIRDRLLAPGALARLNGEARGILLGMINTGYRPSEGANLLPEHIRLDGDVPHITIEPAGRKLKTSSSRRMIPLAGVSLEAFKANPEGFPRYRDKAGMTATINKFLRENGLLETERHTLYGLRHAFEDRMLDRDVDERIRRDLMGHSLNRERYGKGASPEKLLEVVRSIAL